ncbi:Os04g0628800 [Oryza sativa Japonica Group]|nr:Os04g0628800 [Oryza sativa Japonica Group]|eukprot:NP_001174103.1 Os04g0628800 [Oryza sativa Japonica Group]
MARQAVAGEAPRERHHQVVSPCLASSAPAVRLAAALASPPPRLLRRRLASPRSCHAAATKTTADLGRGGHHNNAFFARVGGVSNAEMNRLELELLAVLDFEVMLSHRVYELYREHLEKEARRDGGGGDMLAGASAAAAAKAGRMAAVSPSKLLERAAVNGAAQHDDWRSLGTAAAAEAANGVRRHRSSSSSRYSFDC